MTPMKTNPQEMQMLVQDQQCEKMVIGTILNYGAVYDQLADILDDECFRDGKCLGVWQAIKASRERGESIDIVTVTAELAKEGSTIQPWEVAEMSQEGSVSTTNIEFYAYRLKDLSIRRRLWRLGQKLVNTGIVETDDVADIQQMATEELNGLFGQSRGVITLTQALLKLTDIINDNLNNKHITGSYTGFYKLDVKGGLHGSDLIIIAGESSQGKALRMDELILTPTGWVKNRDLKVGDEVASVDGKPSYVVGVYPQGIKNMYRITFTDGRTAVCSGDHLWEVFGNPSFHGKSRVMTTLDIKSLLEKGLTRKPTLNIPMFCGEFGKHENFVIHPYILGVLIGDGCLTHGVCIANADEFVLDRIRSLSSLPVHITNSKERVLTYRLTQGSKWKENPYRTELENLGMLNKTSYNKFIPKKYLNSDYEQRMQLLNGLMDTDGEVDPYHNIHYSTVSKQLANDVVYLCRSLGFRCSVNTHKSAIGDKNYGIHYRLTIAGEKEKDCVTLPRRRDRIVNRKRVNLGILSVEYVGKEECQCIKVSHPRELFIMRDFIVTHNTALALSIVKNTAEKGEKVAVFSLEMTDVQLTARLVAMKSGVSSSDIMYSNQLNPAQIEMIDTAKGILPGENIFFDDESTSNLESILLSIRNMKLRHDIQGAVVDYLQILNVNQKNSSYTREQAMGDAARRLKNLAKELDIWIIALSQLNRNQQDPVPTMARLRDSGQIAEAADVVMLVYRPEIYHRTFPQPFEQLTEEDVKGKAMIDVAKGRNIGVFKFLVEFNASTTHFTDMDLGESYEDMTPVEESAPF